MSAKAQRAVEDALAVAGRLKAAGHEREAEIIRRVCRSNVGYRITLRQLWYDNMALRDLDGPDCPQPESTAALSMAAEDEPEVEPKLEWCSQCERRVTASQANFCASPFCKAKEAAA